MEPDTSGTSLRRDVLQLCFIIQDILNGHTANTMYNLRTVGVVATNLERAIRDEEASYKEEAPQQKVGARYDPNRGVGIGHPFIKDSGFSTAQRIEQLRKSDSGDKDETLSDRVLFELYDCGCPFISCTDTSLISEGYAEFFVSEGLHLPLEDALWGWLCSGDGKNGWIFCALGDTHWQCFHTSEEIDPIHPPIRPGRLEAIAYACIRKYSNPLNKKGYRHE